ncbi:30S ribosomal protein S27ae [Candidatus Woesearchaeota archaeon]|nr:30S ribosomal protein S27ae [Candidatus Woesearchaeota archaeon]
MAKRAKGKSHPNKTYTLYEGGKKKGQFCPKCGVGVFLAKHKDRLTCGKCGYTEFAGKPKPEEAPKEKKAEEKKEEKPEEKKE